MSTLINRHAEVNRSKRRIALSDVFDLYRQRRALARLDDKALADIGLTREEAQIEANRPFWDIPTR